MARKRPNPAHPGIVKENYPDPQHRIAIDQIDDFLSESARVAGIGVSYGQLPSVGSQWANIYFQSSAMSPVPRSWTTAQQTEIAKSDFRAEWVQPMPRRGN
jgi:hypothetical protein